jgi:CIC family chloride channel protein
MTDLEAGLKRGVKDLKVSDIATKNLIIAYPDQTVHDILLKLGSKDTSDIGRIPVVARDNPHRLLGVLRRHDIIRAQIKAAESDSLRST